MEEAIPRFELEEINPAPSRLPYSKLQWLNGQYIQEMEDLALAKALRPFLEEAAMEVNVDALLVLMPAMKVRLKRLTDAVDFLKFLDEDAEQVALSVDALTHKKLPRPQAAAAFREARDFVREADSYDVETVGEAMMAIGEAHTSNGKAGPFLGRMRLAITRQKVSPPVFESMVALGRERTLARLEEALALLT